MSKKRRLHGERVPVQFPSRRDVLRYGASLAVTMSVADILAACQSSSPTGTTSKAKTLTVAQPLVAQNLDRELNTADQIMQETEMQVAEPLVEWKRKLRSDGNYDFATHSTHWAGAEQTLPASLYRCDKPAFFGSLTWPPRAPLWHRSPRRPSG